MTNWYDEDDIDSNFSDRVGYFVKRMFKDLKDLYKLYLDGGLRGEQGPPGPQGPRGYPCYMIHKVSSIDMQQVQVGEYKVTDLGFQPKSIDFQISSKSGSQDVLTGQGFADEKLNQNSNCTVNSTSTTTTSTATTKVATAIISTPVSTSNVKSDIKTDSCIYLINKDGKPEVHAKLKSIDPDGFTLNIIVLNNAKNYVIRYRAIGC